MSLLAARPQESTTFDEAKFRDVPGDESAAFAELNAQEQQAYERINAVRRSFIGSLPSPLPTPTSPTGRADFKVPDQKFTVEGFKLIVTVKIRSVVQFE